MPFATGGSEVLSVPNTDPARPLDETPQLGLVHSCLPAPSSRSWPPGRVSAGAPTDGREAGAAGDHQAKHRGGNHSRTLLTACGDGWSKTYHCDRFRSYINA